MKHLNKIRIAVADFWWDLKSSQRWYRKGRGGKWWKVAIPNRGVYWVPMERSFAAGLGEIVDSEDYTEG